MAAAKMCRCPARGCTVQVPKSKLFCRSHWFALPKPIRDAIWAHYKPGQTLMTASPGYVAALREAIGFFRPEAQPSAPDGPDGGGCAG